MGGWRSICFRCLPASRCLSGETVLVDRPPSDLAMADAANRCRWAPIGPEPTSGACRGVPTNADLW